MEKLHIYLLIELRRMGEHGEVASHLLTELRPTFRILALPGLMQALRELADKSYVATVESPLSGTRWRITSLGKSALTEEAL